MSFKTFLKEKALVKGAFHRWLGKSEDEPITAADIAKGKAAGGHPEKMAVQAQNFREEVVAEASPVTGTRVVSRHGVGSTHHAEVRYNKDYEEYSVHHYKHGKHLGEGPVSYHGNDKEDAKNTAEHEVKRHNSVAESVITEGKYKTGDTVHWKGMTGDTLAGVVHAVHQNHDEPMYHIKRHVDGASAHKYHSELLHKPQVREELLDERAPLKDHAYHTKSDAELHYIIKDAGEAAKAMQNHSPQAHMKYLDQHNDAATVLHYRSKGGKRVTEEVVNEVKVGDHVHLGFGTKGGAGFRGHVLGVDGNHVHIRSHDAEHGPFGKSHREWKGPLKNVTVERIGEEVMVTVNEKITDSKESLEKAIAAAERKALKAKTRENSSYIEALKKALRRIKGRKNIKSSEVGQTAVAEDTEKHEPSHKEDSKVKRAARFKYKKKFDKQDESTEKVAPLLTELSKKVLSSYRTKAIAQIKSGKGELKGKEVKRFNGAAKSVKEDVSEGKTLKSHDARKLFDKYNARHQSDAEAHAKTPAGQAERKARNDAMLARSRNEEVSQDELDSLYEADTAFHNQDEFTKHAHASGHVVRTVLRGANAHIHAKHLPSGKTHGLFDVKKEHGVYSTSPLHVEEQFEGDELILESEGMSDAAHELVLHADNHAQLHHSSHQPIIKNLKKKAKSGKYDSEKAKKLWGYHADRAAQTYHKEHGDKHTKWHHMFSTSDRKQAAAHWEAHHRHEVHE